MYAIRSYYADEDVVVLPTSCGTGVCAATGVKKCVDAHLVDTCATLAPTGNDSDCDGFDDDCDGQTDEAYPVATTSCGVGACTKAGQRTCQAGQEVDSCQPGTRITSYNVCYTKLLRRILGRPTRRPRTQGRQGRS